MDIVVVLEPDTPTNIRILGPDHTPAEPEIPVRRAHTAPTEASGACGPRTLCGLDTSDMTLAPHRSGELGGARTRTHWHTCSTCRNAGESLTPEAPAAPAAPHVPNASDAPDAPGDGTGAAHAGNARAGDDPAP
ncbi:hypothetical protein [Kitasatospora sp. NPDC057541]|uniref:hypothetical protein n=1 Tax=unclassified Kitasatospora TaxID=2633591 RepID=UPI00369D3D28